MMKARISIRFFLAALAAASLGANHLAALDFSSASKIQGIAGIGLPQTHDNAGEFLLGNIKAQTALTIYGENCSAYLDGSITFDALRTQSTMSATSFASDDGAFHLRLKEAWMDYDGGFWALRAGRQISAWGKADGLQVADVLCPKDETCITASDYADSRLGVDAIRLSLKGEALMCDAYWIPFFTPSSLPLAQNNPLKKTMIPKTISTGTAMIPVADVTKDSFDIPSVSLSNSEAALRLAAFFSFADFSIYGFYGHDREPLLDYALALDAQSNPQALSISGTYERMLMFGADAAVPIKEIVLRFEAAFFPQRYFAAMAERQILGLDKTSRKNQLVALAGFDWNSGGWTITSQYFLDALLDGSENIDRYSYMHQASLSLSKGFLQETLELSFSGLLGLNDFDSMISLKCKYSLTDQFAMTLGSDLFFCGPNKGKKGYYGAYEDLSCVYLQAEFNF